MSFDRSTKRARALAAALICALMLAAALPALADTIGYITGVEITSAGRLVWDEYPGAVDYWLGVDGGFMPVSSGERILGRFEAAGEYDIELDAYTENGEALLATWSGRVEFDGESLKLIWSEDDPGLPTPEATEAPESATEEPSAAPAETKAPSQETDPAPTEPVPEPDLPNQSVTSMLILGLYILLGLFIVVVIVAAVIIIIVVVRKKRK